MNQHRLPVSVLQYNIIHEFEHRARMNSHDLNISVVEGKVAPSLNLLLDHIPPRGPLADLKSREISIYESHLAYLWAFIYSSFVMYEEGVQKPMLTGAFSGGIEFKSPLLRRAKELQDWAIKFTQNFSDWDTTALPNPINSDDEYEEFYVVRVNNIFLQAVSFLLFHEYGHLILDHSTNCKDEWALAQEADADNFATSFFIGEDSSEEERQAIGVSIVLLYASNVFMSERIASLWQVKHPHLHDRIRNGITSLNLQQDTSKFYIYYLASIALQTYLLTKSEDLPRVEMDTAEELFFEYLERIDQLRESGI